MRKRERRIDSASSFRLNAWMREELRLFHLFRVVSAAAAQGAAPKMAEFIVWSSRVNEVFSGMAFAMMCNRGLTPGYHANIEYCGSLTSLPDGKIFESPDKTLKHLSFWITRFASDP